MSQNEPSPLTHKSRVVIVAKALSVWVAAWLIITGLQTAPLSFGPVTGAVLGAIIIAIGVLALTAVLLRSTTLNWGDVGLGLTKRWLPQFGLGTALGLALTFTMLLALILLTPATISRVPDSNILQVIVQTFFVLLILALMEEIVFRSYAFFELRRGFGVRAAVYLSSIVFAFYHGLAPDNLLGPGVWGLFFAWMALTTKSIALPTGFHLGLNWHQALVGLKPKYGDSIWTLSVDSSGGLFAIETTGTVMQVILLVIGVNLVESYARRQT